MGNPNRISVFLKNERKKRCLTQAEMAERLGVNRSTYVTYENGWYDSKKSYKRVPGIKLVKRIAELTGYSATHIQKLIENERKEKSNAKKD